MISIILNSFYHAKSFYSRLNWPDSRQAVQHFASYRCPPNGETPGANGFCADAPLQQWLSSFQAARRQFMDVIVPGLVTHK